MSLRQVSIFSKFKLMSGFTCHEISAKHDPAKPKQPSVKNRNTFSTVTHLLLFCPTLIFLTTFFFQILYPFFFFLSTWCSTLQCLVALILSDNRHCWIPLGFGQVSHRLCETQMKIWCFYRSKWEVTLLINNLLEKHRCERAHYFSWRKRSALLPQMDQRLHRGSGWKHSTDSPLPWISIFLHLHTCIQYKLETCSYF